MAFETFFWSIHKIFSAVGLSIKLHTPIFKKRSRVDETVRGWQSVDEDILHIGLHLGLRRRRYDIGQSGPKIGCAGPDFVPGLVMVNSS